MSEIQKNPDNAMIVTLNVADLRRIVAEEVRAAIGNGVGEDRLVDAKEAAGLLSASSGWLYKNHSRLPFAVKLHHKMLRFSYRGIQRYIAAKKTKGGS